MSEPPDWDITDHLWRHRPAEYVRGHGWIQDDRKVRKIKPSYHWIWPKDGKRGSKWGRMKDILQNKGPDIHIAISADKRDYMYNRQRKAKWSRHIDLDDRGLDGSLHLRVPWVEPFRGDTGKQYDFRTRKYRRPYNGMWTAAIWQADMGHRRMWPEALRDRYGNWWQDRNWLPWAMGGPWKNEIGETIWPSSLH